MVDHFEPGEGNASYPIEKDRMRQLLTKYPALADRHKDSAGNPPKRTWFFPPHYHRHNNLKELVSLCESGYGEVELHLHHGKTKPDTSENLKRTILQCIQEYSRFGIFGEENGVKKYGFIHGDWALDNSRHNQFCGVNNEIEILQETGCYADFTFPAMNTANPAKMNSIYYAQDDPNKPKSHNGGRNVCAHSKPNRGLMIIQGLLHAMFLNRNPLSYRIVGDVLDCFAPVTKERIDLWVKAGVQIQGKEDLVVIKVHTHGATDADAVLGQKMDDIHTHLESQYNDGEKYILHYVTARELYNIIKAVECEKNVEDPEKYRNFRVSQPQYNSSVDLESASSALKDLVGKTYPVSDNLPVRAESITNTNEQFVV
jgi:hypothetical protein